MDNADHQSAASSPAEAAAPDYTVPQRQDCWPNWLGRCPIRSSDRAKIREALETGLPDGPLTVPGPFLCYLTIDGLNRITDQRKLIRGPPDFDHARSLLGGVAGGPGVPPLRPGSKTPPAFRPPASRWAG